jgi:hypothetical protein
MPNLTWPKCRPAWIILTLHWCKEAKPDGEHVLWLVPVLFGAWRRRRSAGEDESCHPQKRTCVIAHIVYSLPLSIYRCRTGRPGGGCNNVARRLVLHKVFDCSRFVLLLYKDHFLKSHDQPEGKFRRGNRPLHHFRIPGLIRPVHAFLRA